MKKIIYTAAVLFLTMSPFFMTGCQEPIFYNIRKEVALEDASVSGDIQNIVRYHSGSTNYLVIANGNILYKDQTLDSYGEWEATGSDDTTNWKPVIDDDTDLHIYQIAVATADDGTEYLYALGGVMEYDSDEGENVLDTRYLYYATSIGGDWTVVDTSNYSDEMASDSTIVRLFCTNTIDPDNRSAYINIDGTAYQLSAGTIEDAETAYTLDVTDSTDIRSAVYFDEGVRFFNSSVSCTNEASGNDATYMYYAAEGVLYYSQNGSTWSSSDPDISDIDSIAVTSDYILLGTDSGVEHVSNTNGVPGDSTADFDTNADSTLSSSYIVQALLAVDPSDTETGGSLYATLIIVGYSSSSSATRDSEGLWSYYPVRGNWNRE